MKVKVVLDEVNFALSNLFNLPKLYAAGKFFEHNKRSKVHSTSICKYCLNIPDAPIHLLFSNFCA
jgi:hypothetical protein